MSGCRCASKTPVMKKHWMCEDFSPICSCSCDHTASAAGGMEVCPGLPATWGKSPGPVGLTGPGQVPEERRHAAGSSGLLCRTGVAKLPRLWAKCNAESLTGSWNRKSLLVEKWWGLNEICSLVNSLTPVLTSSFWWLHNGYGRC